MLNAQLEPSSIFHQHPWVCVWIHPQWILILVNENPTSWVMDCVWHTKRRGRFCSICDTVTVLNNNNVTGLHWGAERVVENGMAANNLCITTQYMILGAHLPCCFYPTSCWLINCPYFLSIESLLSLLCERDIWISTWGWNADVGIWKERTTIL